MILHWWNTLVILISIVMFLNILHKNGENKDSYDLRK